MDTSIMSFVLPASYIKEGKIYRIYFECRNGNLEMSVDSDAGRILWKQEAIFTATFTVEGYLTEFFSNYGGRINYQSEFGLEEGIKRMIMAYGNSSFGYCWRGPEQNNYGVLEVGEHNHLAEMITNSYRNMINNRIERALEQTFEVREEVREEEDEDRR